MVSITILGNNGFPCQAVAESSDWPALTSTDGIFYEFTKRQRAWHACVY